MGELPRIHLVQSSDAPQHSGKLQSIINELIAEKRIEALKSYSPQSITELEKQVGSADMVMSLLTYGLEPDKAKIDETLHKLRQKEIKIAEILVDHINYDNEFITFPVDLTPIRSRQDMDMVWENIEGQLRDIYPKQETIGPKTDWKKYIKYGVGVLVVIIGILIAKGIGRKPFANFKLSPTECPAPCNVSIINESTRAESYSWDFGDDTGISTESSPSHTYTNPGLYTVKLVARANGKESETTQIVKVLSNPNNGRTDDQSFKVTEVVAKVVGNASYTGDCPHLFNFEGTITVNNPGTVKYRWLRNDGATAPEKELTFSSAGSQSVSTTWRLGGAGRIYHDYWQQISILEPAQKLSNRANFNLNCSSP